jgi:hypothetical protein
MKVREFFKSTRSGDQLVIFSGLVAALLVGCNKNSDIKVYRVSKAPLEQSGPQQQDSMPTNTAAPRMPGGGLAPTAETSVTTPPNWEPQPLSQMRQASFMIKGDSGAVADVSFVSLGSAAGNVLENVNRWLGQLGQPPITEQKLGEMAQRLHTSLGDMTIVDLAGLPDNADTARDGRIVAAMMTTADATLFFKMRGNADLTEAQKGEFLKWVAAVCDAQTQTGSAQAAAPPQTTSAPQIKWNTPEGWTEVPPSSMRYASFSAPAEDGGKIDISIVTFPGDGGSDADNINRWRGQMGLAPVDPNAVTSQVAPFKSGDTTFSTTDIAGNNTRTIAAWTRRDGRVWFFKATGPTAAIEKEKPKFVKFIESVRF